MRRLFKLWPLLLVIMLSACGAKDAGKSEILVQDKTEAAGDLKPRKNPCSDLSIPTQITKIGDDWFIVDCYHNEIIYNDNLTDPLSEWTVMTDAINRGHTLAGDGEVYLADDTENERVLVFEKEDGKFLLTQQFENITSRPHYIVYHEENATFYCWCSMSGQMYLFRREEGSSRVYLAEILSIPELDGVYVRSFTIIGNDIYFVSGNSKILKADLDSFEITASYPVPGKLAGMVQLTPIENEFYITVSTDDNWNQDSATIIRCSSLEGLADNNYEDIYRYFIGGGTPYYITHIDGYYYLTEHRIPGHSIWRFSVNKGVISADTVY
ncbi:MAG: hypothetical protein K5985_11470 [Lachnospiraceae bacterium]|nr:hypothetical protein [Lachnospiraceae bacterium]